MDRFFVVVTFAVFESFFEARSCRQFRVKVTASNLFFYNISQMADNGLKFLSRLIESMKMYNEVSLIFFASVKSPITGYSC